MTATYVQTQWVSEKTLHMRTYLGCFFTKICHVKGNLSVPLGLVEDLVQLVDQNHGAVRLNALLLCPLQVTQKKNVNHM